VLRQILKGMGLLLKHWFLLVLCMLGHGLIDNLAVVVMSDVEAFGGTIVLLQDTNSRHDTNRRH
jgi:hypothetical protein